MIKAAFDNIHYVPPLLIKIPSPHLRVKMGTYYIFAPSNLYTAPLVSGNIFAPSNLYTAPLVSGNIFMFIIKQKGEKHKRIEISICRIFCKKRLFRSWELSKAVITQRLQFCVFYLSTIIEITEAPFKWNGLSCGISVSFLELVIGYRILR